MKKEDYYYECLSDACAECGLEANEDQLWYLVEAVMGSTENIGQAFYVPESPHLAEIKELKNKLEAEKRKIFCKTCSGAGVINSFGPAHSSRSSCYKCHGEGRVNP